MDFELHQIGSDVWSFSISCGFHSKKFIVVTPYSHLTCINLLIEFIFQHSIHFFARKKRKKDLHNGVEEV